MAERPSTVPEGETRNTRLPAPFGPSGSSPGGIVPGVGGGGYASLEVVDEAVAARASQGLQLPTAPVSQ